MDNSQYLTFQIRFFGNITIEGLSSFNIVKSEEPVFELDKIIRKGMQTIRSVAIFLYQTTGASS